MNEKEKREHARKLLRKNGYSEAAVKKILGYSFGKKKDADKSKK